MDDLVYPRLPPLNSRPLEHQIPRPALRLQGSSRYPPSIGRLSSTDDGATSSVDSIDEEPLSPSRFSSSIEPLSVQHQTVIRSPRNEDRTVIRSPRNEDRTALPSAAWATLRAESSTDVVLVEGKRVHAATLIENPALRYMRANPKKSSRWCNKIRPHDASTCTFVHRASNPNTVRSAS